MNRKYILVSVLISMIFPLFSQDKTAELEQESINTDYQQVNGLENWTYNYDISDLKDGEYNLIIRSMDKAGNLSIDGPINIFVDSKSDLPTVSISNPSRFMRVGGDINIVGTASDDDGIAFVEVKLDEGTYKKADGSQFWSSILNVSNMEDGRHIITARSTDLNGLEGNETSVIFNVDKIKPIITIDSHSNGEILSGKKNITGYVSDANGISRLEYSLDGENYSDLKLSGKPEHIERKFSLSLDTRDNEGGTSYVRFRTVDGTGSEGSTIFVYYSDNEKPEITIISPLEDALLNGFVTVTGMVTDEVGIETFSSSMGNEEEEIPLLTGNPYWSKTFDLRDEKNAVLTFKAIDLSGNSEEYKLKIKLDVDADKPQVSLIDYEDNEILEKNKAFLKGIASDDDGIKAVEYSIDGGDFLSIDTEGPFILPMDNLELGKHNLQIKSIDIFDIEGETNKIPFVIGDTAPQIVVTEYTTDKTIEPFFDGVIFQQGKTAKISGLIHHGEGDSTILYTIGNEEEKSVKASKGVFSITLSNKMEVGGYNVNLKAVDTLGRETFFESRIYIASQPAKDEQYNPVREDRDGLFIIDARLGNGITANISKENPLTGYITGDSIGSISLDPQQENFTISKNGNQFTISPIKDTAVTTFVIKITSNSGKEYTSENLTVGSDHTKPQLSIKKIQVPIEVEIINSVTKVEINENGEEITVEENLKTIDHQFIESYRIQDKLILKGSYSDVSNIEKAEISFSGSAVTYGGSIPVNAELIDGRSVFEEELNLISLPEGEHFLTLTIVDSLKNSTTEIMPIIIDRTKPSLSILSPSNTDPVEGIITVSGEIGDFTNGGEVLFSRDGIEFLPVKMSSLNNFSHDIDLSSEGVDAEKFLFRVIDKNRNFVDFKPIFNVDIEADRPKVAIEIPAEGSTIRNDFSVTGLVFDDDAVGKIYYSLDGADFIGIDGNSFYNIPFNLSNINDGKHNITVKAEDSGGFMSEEVSSIFLISKAEPVSVLISPAIDVYIKQTIILEGETYDENGVDDIFVSYDNGITYNEAEINDVDISDAENNTETIPEVVEEFETISTVQWKYTLDTRLPGDGTHSILIKAIDGAGTEGISSTILNIDNTFPEIKLDSPHESGKAAGKLIIDGKVFDGTRIKSVVSELKSLEGQEFEPLIREIQTDGVFRDILDVSDFFPGLYNLNITVTDFADNSISETRNLYIIPPEEGEFIDLLFPEEGKELYGPFTIEGRLHSEKGINKVVLKIDDSIKDTIEVDGSGLFSFPVSPDELSDGNHKISVVSSDSEAAINSDLRNIRYKAEGPWVRVSNMTSGQFVSGRPIVEGFAGYNGFEEDKSKAVDNVEVSLDNGKSFVKAKGRDEWEFRLETYDLPEGENQLIIRAHFKDGSTAVTKFLVNVDETAPQIDLFTPEENRKFNETVALVGTASDSNGLERVEVLIRKGSKERYKVPSFIQGLYIDFHALGTTYGELGVGLSFFDDVVKIQAQVGLAPPGRFTGIVFGAKLLATIVDLPFSYFFGYDWDFFSMSVAVGANFNYYTMSEDGYYFTNEGVVLGSVLLQYEFAKFELKNLKVFNSYSFYVEGALWFISSDIEAGVVPTLSFGARIGIF
ncbi:MAG: Ig-like domain-containing protein [Spirochaetaceae bacterium]|jgi:hypothetical protein|nr:Ig-like domain-containing protein [Spirochaetaceae bacterium]